MRHPRPQTDPESSTPTRQQQRGKDPLTPLSLEESKTRENNLAHMRHLREAMKKGLEKWDEELRKEKDWAKNFFMENDKEWLGCWLEDLELVLRATDMSPIYIPNVREEWIKAAKQKPFPILEDPEEPPRQPNKPTDHKPAIKHVAKKNGGRRQKSDNKNNNEKDESQQ